MTSWTSSPICPPHVTCSSLILCYLKTTFHEPICLGQESCRCWPSIEVTHTRVHLCCIPGIVCFVVICCGLVTVDFTHKWYPSRLFHWHWGNHMIAPVPLKQPWRISVQIIHNQLLYNHNKAKQNHVHILLHSCTFGACYYHWPQAFVLHSSLMGFPWTSV